MMAPFARIALRYGVGFILGAQIGQALAADADMVLIVAAGLGAAVEAAYALARRKGWTT